MKVTYKQIDQSDTSVVVYARAQTDSVTNLIGYIAEYNEGDNQIVIHENGRTSIIQISEIITVEVQNKDLTITTTSNIFHVRGALSKMMEKLTQHSFALVSQSATINLRYLDSLVASFSGTMTAHLKNGQQVAVSRRFVPLLRQRIKTLQAQK